MSCYAGAIHTGLSLRLHDLCALELTVCGTFPTLMFGYVANAAFVRTRGRAFAELQPLSLERSFSFARCSSVQTAFLLRAGSTIIKRGFDVLYEIPHFWIS
jgi:hypothetical protein